MFLLDTCLFSEFAKPKPDDSVLAWARAVPLSQQFLSILVLGELLRVVALMPDGIRKRNLANWIEGLTSKHRGRIIGLDADTMRCWADTVSAAERRGKRPAAMDSLIAAQCLANKLTLVTRNVADFADFGIKIHNPWRTENSV